MPEILAVHANDVGSPAACERLKAILSITSVADKQAT